MHALGRWRCGYTFKLGIRPLIAPKLGIRLVHRYYQTKSHPLKSELKSYIGATGAGAMAVPTPR